MELGSYFLFLQEQIKDIIIIRPRGHANTQGRGKPADESEQNEGSRQDCYPSARPRVVKLDKHHPVHGQEPQLTRDDVVYWYLIQ